MTTIDMDDLVTIGQIAERLQMKVGTVRMWSYRRAKTGFPQELLQLSGNKLYSWTAVRNWYTIRCMRRAVG